MTATARVVAAGAGFGVCGFGVAGVGVGGFGVTGGAVGAVVEVGTALGVTVARVVGLCVVFGATGASGFEVGVDVAAMLGCGVGAALGGGVAGACVACAVLVAGAPGDMKCANP